MMKQLLLLIGLFAFALQSNAQEKVTQTFKDTRVINTHTVETLKKRKLDIRIGHRFGDLGDGWETFYGLENASDVLIGGEYGVSDRLTVGLGRTKGSGPLKALVSGTVKYKIFEQAVGGGSPFTVTALAVGTASTMKKSTEPTALNFFSKSSHRFMYSFHLIIGKKFGERFSMQFIPGWTHRNVVLFEDENDVMTAGFAARFQLTKVLGIIVDYTQPLSSFRTAENNYYPPFGVGLEIDTGGHVFQVNFTNATGIVETDYIPNTRSSWGDGQFRLGFTVSRVFNL